MNTLESLRDAIAQMQAYRFATPTPGKAIRQWFCPPMEEGMTVVSRDAALTVIDAMAVAMPHGEAISDAAVAESANGSQQLASRAVEASLYATPQPAAPDKLRDGVRSIVAMLAIAEYANFLSDDADLAALDIAISELIGKVAASGYVVREAFLIGVDLGRAKTTEEMDAAEKKLGELLNRAAPAQAAGSEGNNSQAGANP